MATVTNEEGTVVGTVDAEGKVYKNEVLVGWVDFFTGAASCRVYYQDKVIGGANANGDLYYADFGQAGHIDPGGHVTGREGKGWVEPTVPLPVMGGAALLLLLSIFPKEQE